MDLLKYWETKFNQKLFKKLKIKMYIVSADATPNSRKHQMTTICRYVGETGQPRERLISLKHVTSKTGEATADYIIQTLRCNSLDTEKLVFQPYDFTNSIPGHLGGALQEEELNIIDAMTLTDSTVSNLRDMNNNRQVTNINQSLDFLEPLGENPRKEFSRKQTRKIPLRYDEKSIYSNNIKY